ncbi:unnamed protein product [Lactuca saligna]|uniref:Uncharacterized protein n=1 Tax=Lactuca saligna TaxID=75948 RepID=A0AA35V4Z0_LACSI|nr:unnamed protein product [Lactuca saligna]
MSTTRINPQQNLRNEEFPFCSVLGSPGNNFIGDQCSDLQNQVVVSGEENRLQENATVRTTRIVVSKVSFYTTYTCSPPVTGDTKATLTINSFQKGGDGGGPSECDNQYHSDDTPVVRCQRMCGRPLGVSEDNWGDLDITWTE